MCHLFLNLLFLQMIQIEDLALMFNISIFNIYLNTDHLPWLCFTGTHLNTAGSLLSVSPPLSNELANGYSSQLLLTSLPLHGLFFGLNFINKGLYKLLINTYWQPTSATLFPYYTLIFRT